VRDRSAFDAYLEADATTGPVFLGVETKYTDPFSPAPPTRRRPTTRTAGSTPNRATPHDSRRPTSCGGPCCWPNSPRPPKCRQHHAAGPSWWSRPQTTREPPRPSTESALLFATPRPGCATSTSRTWDRCACREPDLRLGRPVPHPLPRHLAGAPARSSCAPGQAKPHRPPTSWECRPGPSQGKIVLGRIWGGLPDHEGRGHRRWRQPLTAVGIWAGHNHARCRGQV